MDRAARGTAGQLLGHGGDRDALGRGRLLCMDYGKRQPVTGDDYEMVFRLLAALAAGALIGYERSFHGRPAGFRTHALVCTASSLLMLVTVYESHWMSVATGRVQL